MACRHCAHTGFEVVIIGQFHLQPGCCTVRRDIGIVYFNFVLRLFGLVLLYSVRFISTVVSNWLVKNVYEITSVSNGDRQCIIVPSIPSEFNLHTNLGRDPVNDRSGSGELSSNIETIILGTRLLVRFWYSLHFHIQLPADLGSPGKRAVKRVCVSYPYTVVGCWRGYLSGARCRLVHSPPDATATHCLLLQ